MSRKTILSVEDNADLRLLIRLTLAFEGYEIHEATNAAQGMQMLRQRRPDLLLLDVMMPGDSGLEMMRRVNDDPVLNRIPVIMVSALGSEQDVQAGIQAGARAYLVKPFNPWELVQVVLRTLGPGRPAGGSTAA